MSRNPRSLNSPFIVACINGDLEKIHELFGGAGQMQYLSGLQHFIDFLVKNPPDEKDYVTICSYRKVLLLFAQHNDLYKKEDIIKAVKTLSQACLPMSTILFRHFLRESLYVLNQPEKDGCSRMLVSTQSRFMSSKVKKFLECRTEDERLKLSVDYPVLELIYRSRKNPGHVKWKVVLGKEHIQLKAALPRVNEGNVATVSISFMMKISGEGHEDSYKKITLPLLIPTNGSLQEPSLHFDDLSTRVANPYQQLRALYNRGLAVLHIDAKSHGQTVNYENPEASRAADSIKHSEQGLALYLSDVKNVRALIIQLLDKLHSETKSLALLGDTIKIIAIALHFHSQKTPCSVCEYVLTGLMDNETGAFLKVFKEAILAWNKSLYAFKIPKSGVKLHVLYSADDIDADHRSAPSYHSVNQHTAQSMRDRSNQVFCTLFRNGLHRDYKPFVQGDDLEVSVLSSGGEASERKRHTNQKANEKHQDAHNGTFSMMSFFAETLRALQAPQIQEDQKQRDILKIKFEAYEGFVQWLQDSFALAKQDIKGNGNCQFYALAEQLCQIHPNHFPDFLVAILPVYDRQNIAQRLRMLAVMYLREHQAEFEGLIGEEDFSPDWQGEHNFENYLYCLQQDRFWGGECVLKALSQVLKLPILVLDPGVMTEPNQLQNKIYLPDDQEMGELDVSQALVIIFDGVNHYETIATRPTDELIEFVNHMLHDVPTEIMIPR